MKPFIVIGGAGYVGLELVDELLNTSCEKLYVVSRNTQKAVLLRDARVNVVTNLSEINEEGILVNLAFANSSDYTFIRSATKSLINDVQAYDKRVGFSFLVHVSTVVLSERGLNFGEISKQDGYLYSKSLQEHLITKCFDTKKVAIVRAGNILSPHSPWMHKIASKLVTDAPMAYKGQTSSSNATNLNFLVKKIIELGMTKRHGTYDCSELSKYRWDKFTHLTAQAIGIERISEFECSITEPISIWSFFKMSLLGFALTLNSSPWHSDNLNRIVNLKWVPVSTDKIRRAAKFKRPTTFKVDTRTAKDFKLFCNSTEVNSSFVADYDEEAFFRSLIIGLGEMGF